MLAVSAMFATANPVRVAPAVRARVAAATSSMPSPPMLRCQLSAAAADARRDGGAKRAKSKYPGVSRNSARYRSISGDTSTERFGGVNNGASRVTIVLPRPIPPTELSRTENNYSCNCTLHIAPR